MCMHGASYMVSQTHEDNNIVETQLLLKTRIPPANMVGSRLTCGSRNQEKWRIEDADLGV